MKLYGCSQNLKIQSFVNSKTCVRNMYRWKAVPSSEWLLFIFNSNMKMEGAWLIFNSPMLLGLTEYSAKCFTQVGAESNKNWNWSQVPVSSVYPDSQLEASSPVLRKTSVYVGIIRGSNVRLKDNSTNSPGCWHILMSFLISSLLFQSLCLDT